MYAVLGRSSRQISILLPSRFFFIHFKMDNLFTITSSRSTISATNYYHSSSPIEMNRLTDHPFYLSHSHTPSVHFINNSRSKERNNSNRKARSRRRKQAEEFHSRNMITVRRVPCQWEGEERKNHSQLPENRRKLSNTVFSDHFILHNDVKKKMANSPAPSLLSTHLPTTVYDSTKPDVTEDICTMPGINRNKWSLFDICSSRGFAQWFSIVRRPSTSIIDSVISHDTSCTRSYFIIKYPKVKSNQTRVTLRKKYSRINRSSKKFDPNTSSSIEKQDK